MKHHIQSIAIGAALFTLGGIGCGGSDEGPLSSIDALVILQRPRRNDVGDVFQYTSYKPGARLVKLSPPTADGTLTTLCCDAQGPDFKNIDIQGYDLSFDAKSIVFSARRGSDPTFGLFLLQLSDGHVDQIMTDPLRDYVSPIFLPGNRVMFTANAVVESGAAQFKDEYDRNISIQLGRVNLDGTGMELGPRNLSHRTFPSLASDGRVIFTQWDHLGPSNEANLMFVDQDMQELREGFGKEGKGAANSHIKAREISKGRFIVIGTARDRTVNAGKLIDARLGNVENHDGEVSAPNNQAEANATYRDLTPDVPKDGMPSAETVGRYYDAYPLNAKDKPDLLVSWADGAVESGELASAGVTANFGIYLYDSEHQQRRPILDDKDMWDIFAQPLRTRSVPPVVGSAQDPRLGNQQTLIGSMNVYESSLHSFLPGEIYGVRVMEGFSVEEIPGARMFGTTMFEGHANLGVVPVTAGGSWSAKVPANVPLHLQTVDKFGMSQFNETVWFSGRGGEARVCGGCHESRTATTNVPPGVLDGFVAADNKLFATTPRAQRMNANPKSATEVVGVGWSTQVQPVLTANCVTGCHDANNSAHVPGYTITDMTTGTSVSWSLNLTGDTLPPLMAVAAGGGAYSASYFSIAGPDMEAIEKNHLMISGNFKVYMKPTDAAHSPIIQKINPTQLFPVDATKRAFTTTPHLRDPALPGGPRTDLDAQGFYTLILAADMGVNYYARENKP